jgi:sensor histidine kinase YesM
MPTTLKIFFYLLPLLLWASSAFGFINLQTQNLYQISGNLSHCRDLLDKGKNFSFSEITAHRSYCLLIEFDIAEAPTTQQVLFISALAASEFVLDGKRLGGNGQVGESVESETPGNIEFLINLSPQQLQAGRHQLVLKLSTFHAPANLSQYFYSLFIQDQEQFYRHKQLRLLLPLLLCGGLLLVGVIIIAFALAIERQSHWRIFGLLCVSASLMLLAESWRSLIGYAYPLHINRLNFILYVAGVFSILLPWYFLLLYRTHKIFLWLMSAAIIVIIIGSSKVSFDGKVHLMLFSALIISLLIHWQPMKTNFPGSGIGICIVALSVSLNIWQSWYFAEQGFAWMVCLLLLPLLYQMVQQFRYEKTKAARAIQLENQLLHRSIQPHFLMNSLTLISELIHHSPVKAEEFIQALAKEFHLLNQYVAQPKIPLEKEIALCQNYLDMMNLRQQLRHELVVTGEVKLIEVPPALLLTLLENAFSHNKYTSGLVFELRMHQQKNSLIMSFRLPKGVQQTHEGMGMGNLYIQHSLQQVFSQKATYQLQEVDDAWLAIFTLHTQ